MGHIWREQGVDVGIDGTIEIIDGPQRAATGRVLFVQSKATAAERLPGETATSFTFKCRSEDVEYWLAASNPVLLVVSHVERGEAWFKNLWNWFDTPDRRSTGVVEFDKSDDRFDASASQRLLDVSAPPGSGAYLQPVPKAESLTSNLLKVDLPDAVYVAPSRAMGWKAINGRLRQNGQPIINDVAWANGLLYSFQPFSSPERRCLADDAQEELQVGDLQHAPNEEERQIFRRLLYHTLRSDLTPSLRWNQRRWHFHFPPTRKLGERVVKVGKVGTGRTVFKAYMSRKDPSAVAYYRHYAAELRLVDLDDDWHLVISPTYYFSHDGYEESRFADDSLAGIKRLEGHEAIRQQTVFWARYLAGEDNLFSDDGRVLKLSELASVAVDHGIDDKRWKPREKEQRARDDAQLELDIDS